MGIDLLSRKTFQHQLHKPGRYKLQGRKADKQIDY